MQSGRNKAGHKSDFTDELGWSGFFCVEKYELRGNTMVILTVK